MTSPVSIALIGAGNVAWHLGRAFEQAGHQIVLVYSRTLVKAEFLAETLLQAHPTQELDFSLVPATIFIVALKDDVVAEVLQRAIFPKNSLVVHTSGSLPISVFKVQANIRGGVFYLVQTFSKAVAIDFQKTPIGVEASNPEDVLFLKNLAASISEKVIDLPTETRKIIHLAAVFACNFTNHLLGISHDLLTQQQIDFTILQPLVIETVQKAFAHAPFRVQTGPAVRFDQNILAQHQQLLQDKPDYAAIYTMLTESIQKKAQEITMLNKE
ncbi:Rossmann-like and DUF2520 domain-containing protein [Adhaeribacter pallidiroseus]|uniref:Pyrroline-5-carboxylate reductase n=1 Tax=Adhaeribacter pallidiroseus TaxID=2072847 RepID=A0A369QLN6_9BACT|nr:Rossmann-like and DUF2520 domain-containing protein [Adhaeribacter pallidiroseus]RDC65282.1 hypothetical protein AHMF7616_03912 [Adhaeribacter pallidiroseus]